MHFFFENPGTPPYKRGGTVTGKTQNVSWTVSKKDGQRQYRYTARLQASPSPQKQTNISPSMTTNIKANKTAANPAARAILCKQTPTESLQAYPLYSSYTLQPTLFGAKTGPYTDASYVQKETSWKTAGSAMQTRGVKLKNLWCQKRGAKDSLGATPNVIATVCKKGNCEHHVSP